MIAGKNLMFRDEFLTSFDTAVWSTASSTGTPPAWLHDNAADGHGAIQCSTTSGTSIIDSIAMPIGTKDFGVSFRERCGAPTLGSSQIRVYSGTAAKIIGFTNLTTGNWKISVNGTVTIDSGVARSSSYKQFDVVRVSGVSYFYVDGVLVYSEADTQDRSDAYIRLSCAPVSSNSPDTRVDNVSYWISR